MGKIPLIALPLVALLVTVPLHASDPGQDEVMAMCQKAFEKYDRKNRPPLCADTTASLKIGDVCTLRPREIRPTQGAVGMVAVDCKVEEKITKPLAEADSTKEKKEALWDYFGSPKRLVPTVVGPEEKLYIIDRHHTSTALFRAELPKKVEEERLLNACISRNWNEMNADAFWRAMEKSEDPKMVWLRDEKGRTIGPDQLPTSLKTILDDPYRTLSRWVRDSNGYIKCSDMKKSKRPAQCNDNPTPYYLEFFWADLFRDMVPIGDIYRYATRNEITQLEAHFGAAMEAAASDEAKKELGLKYGYNESIEPKPVELKSGCEVKKK